MIFLDTPVLSARPDEVILLEKMIADNEPLAIPGIVFQEFLSGLKEEVQFQKLQKLANSFPIILATQQDHLEAAKIANVCRRHGVATSATDCLIAAMAIVQKAQLFTLDQDFVYMARYCPIPLFPKPSTEN